MVVAILFFYLLFIPTHGQSSTCFDRSESHSSNFPLIYALIFIGIMFVASIYYFFMLKRRKIIYVKSFSSGIAAYVRLFIKFRSMYGLMFTQLFDQVSDISVIYQLGSLAQDERGGAVDCECMLCVHIQTGYTDNIIAHILICQPQTHSILFLQLFRCVARCCFFFT